MTGILDVAKISPQNQIVIPKSVRQVLNVGFGEKVVFKDENNKVVIEKA